MAVISRTDVDSLIETQVANEIFEGVTKESKALLRGEYGKLPGEVNEAVRKKAIKDEEFIKEYDKWVPLDVKSKMDKIEAMSRDYDIEKNTEILKTAMIYINVNDDDYTASAKELYEFINDELDNFKDKNK